MLNKVCLIGRLGADPESRRLNNGNTVVNLRLATSETWRDKSSGERKEKTEWHQIVIFNEGIAGVAEKYLKKGALIYIEGKLQTRQWEKDGEKRYSTEVVLNQFDSKLVMMGSKDDEGGGGSRGGSSGGRRDDRRDDRGRDDRGGSRSSQQDIDDEIPF